MPRELLYDSSQSAARGQSSSLLCRCRWCRAGANRSPHNNSYVSFNIGAALKLRDLH